MSTATLTSKGQITIPIDIRSQLGLGTGDRVNFIIEESGKVVFVPVKSSVKTLRGIIKKPENKVSVEEMKNAIKAKVKSKL